MTKYRLTYEFVIDVWAKNEEEAIEKGNEERLNGTYDALVPDVEELEEKHKPFCVVWDIGHATDGIECDTYEEAEATAIDLFISWMQEEKAKWDGDPTQEQIEHWNEMIDTCWCVIVEWEEDWDTYEDVYYGKEIGDEKKEEIGWKEI